MTHCCQLDSASLTLMIQRYRTQRDACLKSARLYRSAAASQVRLARHYHRSMLRLGQMLRQMLRPPSALLLAA